MPGFEEQHETFMEVFHIILEMDPLFRETPFFFPAPSPNKSVLLGI